MKKTIRLTEYELRTMISETVKSVIYKGLTNDIKSKFWKMKNLPKVNPFDEIENQVIQQHKRDNQKPYNPYTYNKQNFHQEEPEYGSEEFDKMYNADDGWVMAKIQRDIRNMKSYLNGKKTYDESLMYLIGNDNDYDSIQMAKRYGLTKYYQYLDELYKKVIQKHESEINNN